jgi:DNA-binding response OmpR family regulator
MGIVRGHGGFLTVDSRVGVGTEFRLYLPAAVGNAVPEEPKLTAPAPRGAGETILVIDDDRNLRELMSRVFTFHGYSVVTAKDGVQGLEAYRRHRASVGAAVVDMMMPRMQGAEVIRRLQAHDATLGIVAVSGMPLSRTRLTEVDGRLVFLQKPMSMRVILETIKSLIDTRAARKGT